MEILISILEDAFCDPDQVGTASGELDKGTQGNKEFSQYLLTGGSLVTDGRVTQNFRKEKVRSNNSNDGNYLLLWGFSRS
jgi:hypothetical protein